MQIKELLESSKGKFFTVTFTKKDGSTRVLNGRLGVTKHLKGGKKTVTQENYLTVFDTQKKAYRTVNVETVKSIKINGETYKVDGGETWKRV